MKNQISVVFASLLLLAPTAFGSEGVIMANIQKGISKIVVNDDSVATAEARFKFAMTQYAADGRLVNANYAPNENEQYTYIKRADRIPEDKAVPKKCAVSIYSLTAPTVSFAPSCQP